MKTYKETFNRSAGFTFLEITVILLVLLSLMATGIVGSRIYAERANEASCVVLQDVIRKVLISQANIGGQRLEPGIDYAQEPDFEERLGFLPVCPAVGGYSAIVGPNGELTVRCLEHAHGE